MIPFPSKAIVLQNMRIDFQFDKAAFAFKALPFKLPYPVPFKLLGDETKVLATYCACSMPNNRHAKLFRSTAWLHPHLCKLSSAVISVKQSW